jgi:hypothetical protein
MKNLFKTAVVILPAALFALGCTSARTAFPDNTEKAEFSKLKVEGRGGFSFFTEKMSFGGYSVQLFRGWTSSDSSSSFIPFVKDSTQEKEQKYSFRIAGPDGFSSEGKCRAFAKAEQQGVRLFKVSVDMDGTLESSLEASFISSGTDKSEMKISGSIESKKGTVKGDAFSFQIQSTRKIEKSRWETADVSGYYIMDNGMTLAVVDVLSGGTVYIRKNIKKEYLPAVISSTTALLAYNDVAKDIKNDMQNKAKKK